MNPSLHPAALRYFASVVLGGLAACGAHQAPTATSSPAASASTSVVLATPAVSGVSASAASAPAEPKREGARELPTACASDAKTCTPPAAFAASVCRGKFPDLPLFLFAKGTPWQRAYVKAEWVEPVNAYGGDRTEAWMHFGEELLVLHEHRPSGAAAAVKVSGPSDLDVLRWDGTCATIRQEMLVAYVPAPMDSPRIVWKRLDTGVQEALLTDELVKRAHDIERRDCKGASASHPSPTCDKAMRKLTDTIVLAVKRGIQLPLPAGLPEWK